MLIKINIFACFFFLHTYLKSLYNNITLLGVFELFSLLNNSEKKIDFHPRVLLIWLISWLIDLYSSLLYFYLGEHKYSDLWTLIINPLAGGPN